MLLNVFHYLIFKQKLFLLCTIVLIGFNLNAQKSKAYTDVDKSKIVAKKNAQGQQQKNLPNDFRAVEFDIEELRKTLDIAMKIDAYEVRDFFTNNNKDAINALPTITIPLPNGNDMTFRIWRSTGTPLKLIKLMNENGRFFYGINGADIEGNGISLNFILGSSVGIDISISGTGDQIIIESQNFSRLNKKCLSTVAERSKYPRPTFQYGCGAVPNYENSKKKSDSQTANSNVSQNALRTYKIAIAVTSPFINYRNTFENPLITDNIEKKLMGQEFVSLAVEKLNEIYNKEMGINFEIVDNNIDVIFVDSATDPYTNNATDNLTILNQNQAELDNTIVNYDIGHVFTKIELDATGSAIGATNSEALIGCICNAGQKARGVSKHPFPSGNPFFIDFFSHEVGHQLGASHTFTSCNFPDGASTPPDQFSYCVEPGGGSTIMAYPGKCLDEFNIQFFTESTTIADGAFSDPYIHAFNQQEIINNITTNVCGTTTTGSTLPSANAGQDYIIPKSTPFTLEGSVSNLGSGLTASYCWEEMDKGNIGNSLNDGQNPTTLPLFRSYIPISTTSRTFPKIEQIINNTNADYSFTQPIGTSERIGECLPNLNYSISPGDSDGALDFRFTVRAFNPQGLGNYVYDDMEITVTTNGPFTVTQPNTAIIWQACTEQNIEWDVAGTNNAPISCANVGILLSTDGGYTYPIVLASNTPNDGSENITVPSISSSTVRIKVACSDNIFFDISDTDFTINNSGVSPPIDQEIQLDIEHPCIDENNGKVRILNPQDGLIYKWIGPDGNEIDSNDIYQKDLEPGIYQIEIISPSGCIYNQLFILEEETCLNTNCDFDIIVVDECDGYDDDIHPVELIIISNSNDIEEYSISGSISQTNVTEGSYYVDLDHNDNYYFNVTNNNNGCSKELTGAVRRCEAKCEAIPGVAPTFEIYDDEITICEDHFGEICLDANYNDPDGNPPGVFFTRSINTGNWGNGSANLVNSNFDFEANLLCLEIVIDTYNPIFIAEYCITKQGTNTLCGSDFLVINVCPVSTNTYPIFACSDELFVLNDFFESNTYDWEAILPDGVEGETSGTVVDGDGISFTNTTNTNQTIILDVNTIATNPECNCSQSETIQVILAPTSDINCTSNNLCISEELASDFEDVECTPAGSVWDGVCGCNNKYYSSDCAAQKAGIMFWIDGPCPKIEYPPSVCWNNATYTLRLQNCTDCTDIDWQVENGTIVGGDDFEKEILWDKPHERKQQSVKVFANQQGLQREVYRKIKFKKAYEVIEDQTICEGEEVQLWGKGASKYTWYEVGYKGEKKKVHEGKKFRVAPIRTTTYELEMENPFSVSVCCNGNVTSLCNQTVTVSVGDNPFVNAGGDKFITPGSSVMIGTVAVAGLQYDWSPSIGLSATDQAQVQASPTATINYTLKVTDPATECSSSDDVQVRVRTRPEKPIITIGNKPNVIIRPNPVRNFTSLQLQSDGVMNRIEITNIIGNTVYNNDNVQADTQQINCSTWQKGLYKVHVTIDTDTGTEHWYGKMLVL